MEQHTIEDLKKFAEELRLSKDQFNNIIYFVISKKEIDYYYNLLKTNSDVFLDEMKKISIDSTKIMVIYFYLLFMARRELLNKNVPLQVITDTFYDYTLWCNKYYDDNKKWGLEEYVFLKEHIAGKLYRLGRLEFEIEIVKKNIYLGQVCIKAFTPFLNIHVPQGEPLTPQACDKSFEHAKKFFCMVPAIFRMNSWLLDDQLQLLLNKNSNILSLQQRFIVLEKSSSIIPEKYIFGRICKNKELYPAKTHLQRKAKEFLLRGNMLNVCEGWNLSYL